MERITDFSLRIGPPSQKTTDYYLPNERQSTRIWFRLEWNRVKARNDPLLLYFTAAGLNKSKHRIWRETRLSRLESWTIRNRGTALLYVFVKANAKFCDFVSWTSFFFWKKFFNFSFSPLPHRETRRKKNCNTHIRRFDFVVKFIVIT